MHKYLRWIAVLVCFFSAGALSAGDDGDLIDYSGIPLLRYVGEKPPGTYEAYMATRSKAPFSIRRVIPGAVAGGFDTSRAAAGRIIVLVHAGIRPSIQTELTRYISDISARGYQVELFETSGGTAENLRAFLQTESADLAGCVFVGNIAAAWYEISNDFNTYGYATFPMDLFFMDLDGTWIDADTDGRYDGHSAGSGDEGPEIFIGRIDTSMMTGNEIDMLRDYFDKNHDFWSGVLAAPYYGLTYTEDDWAGFSYFLNDIQYAYPAYEAIAAPATNGDDYIQNRVPGPQYEFIQLSCHSSPTVHGFTRGSWIYSSDVISSVPYALLYNLFCCSSSRYTETDYLGGAYIFNSSTTSLATIGSTKTGSMLVFSEFYQPMGQGKSFGQAFKEWFDTLAPYSFDEICWHFGMTISGDPLLVVSDQLANHAPELSNPQVTPANGYYGTRFEYTVHYFDSDGGHPDVMDVYIDGTPYQMNFYSGQVGNATYRYRTRDIDVGVSHTYSFYAEDSEGGSDGLPAAGTYNGPETYDPELYLSGTPEPGAWMTMEVWGAVDALWAAAWSSESGPHYVPVTGLFWDLGPGDLHMAKRITADPLYLDAFGYGSYDFKLPGNISSGTKYIQAGTKVNAYWGQTSQELFIIP